MKLTFFFKIMLLTLMLVGILYVIRSLNVANVEKAMTAIGVEPGAPGAPGLKASGRAVETGEERLSICPTRITAIEFEGLRKVEEQKSGMKLKWMAHDPGAREINTLEVEKWLSRHCQVVVREVKAFEVVAPAGSVTLRFVDGRQEAIERVGSAGFKIEGQLYQSADFADALTELQEIAQFAALKAEPAAK